jgi:tRNA1(Val) A37 N6-methylase TrmN6
MTARLGVSDKDLILEPSAGEGIFIDEILKSKKNVHIDALDIDERAIDILNQKYKDNSTVSVRKTDTLFDTELDAYDSMQLWLKQTDTLMDEQLDYYSVIGGHYSKIIGNPPYGAWQDYEKRDLLKKKYAGQYVRETYSLFLLRCLSVLKLHGRLSFIIPDTYLFLNLHSRIREILLTKTKIDEILIFPSKFFPGVSFGYSNLSIITLERCEQDEAISNMVRIIQGFQSPHEFSCLCGQGRLMEHLKVYKLRQGDILNNLQHRFIIGDNSSVTLLSKKNATLADVADIVTGFYTGNNKKFIRVLDDTVKGAKGYVQIDTEKIYDCNSTQGIDVDEGYVPYIKSSSKQRYLREKDEWFVRWDTSTVSFYNNDKQARFQNSSFYFNIGVGIPMVKSSTIRAFLMENRVFDQSIVGIFPRDPADLKYILALMNSDSINELIHIINPTANNSSNYVKQLPYIEPDSKTKQNISRLVDVIFSSLREGNQKQAAKIHKTINTIISGIYGKPSNNV